MPNWCSNTLWVEGNPEQMQEFISKSVKPNESNSNYNEFTLEGLYPTPPELLNTSFPNYPKDDASETEKMEYQNKVKELEKKYGFSDWYSWRINSWGTKWDVCESAIHQQDEANFMVTFDSAWAPPLIWLERIVPQFPELKFKLAYSEPGMAFCGVAYTGEDGTLTYEEGELEYTDEDNKPVEYDSDAERWKYTETGEIIEDEDFYPIDVNPYLD
mgnify:CR=1 FL=1